MNKEPSVIMDIMNDTFAQGKKLDSLNYDYIHQLFPHLVTALIQARYEAYTFCGLKTIKNILEYFQQDMIAIKRTKVSGVDLAREERINKVDLII